jgi:hypothetical protein
LHSSISTSRDIEAHLLNFSEKGICFATDTQMIPGTTILFKASDECRLKADDSVDCELRSMSMVQIKWCNHGAQKDRAGYTVGATYL